MRAFGKLGSGDVDVDGGQPFAVESFLQWREGAGTRPAGHNRDKAPSNLSTRNAGRWQDCVIVTMGCAKAAT
jgi:hypothetical protein